MTLETLRFVHVVPSLLAIAAGLAFVSGLLRGRERTGSTPILIVTTIATS